jgi:hypothetical protein
MIYNTHVRRPPVGVGGVELMLEYVEVISSYTLGYDAGAADANMLLQPHNTNGYTRETYIEINSRFQDYYERALYEDKPYIDGYCDGADQVALSAKGDLGCTALVLAGSAKRY